MFVIYRPWITQRDLLRREAVAELSALPPPGREGGYATLALYARFGDRWHFVFFFTDRKPLKGGANAA